MSFGARLKSGAGESGREVQKETHEKVKKEVKCPYCDKDLSDLKDPNRHISKCKKNPDVIEREAQKEKLREREEELQDLIEGLKKQNDELSNRLSTYKQEADDQLSQLKQEASQQLKLLKEQLDEQVALTEEVSTEAEEDLELIDEIKDQTVKDIIGRIERLKFMSVDKDEEDIVYYFLRKYDLLKFEMKYGAEFFRNRPVKMGGQKGHHFTTEPEIIGDEEKFKFAKIYNRIKKDGLEIHTLFHHMIIKRVVSIIEGYLEE